jgi:hypothetical protein
MADGTKEDPELNARKHFLSLIWTLGKKKLRNQSWQQISIEL